MIRSLTANDFSVAFGCRVDDLPSQVLALVEEIDFRLRTPTASERDSLLIECIKKIRDDSQIVGDKSRTSIWEEGWDENRKDYAKTMDEQSLVPKFMRAGQPIRWSGEFFFPENPNFEVDFAKLLRAYVFDLFEKMTPGGLGELHEFGAGTGWNLLSAWEFYGPRVQLVGSDFVPSSVELMREVGAQAGAQIESRLFDMISPDTSYKFSMPSRAGVFTYGSLEQLAGNLEPMVDFLIASQPGLVISIEPAIETYEQNSIVDYLGYWFQEKRGYSAGLIGLLREREAKGLITVHKIKRLGFGSMMMEGYNLFIWSPAA